MSVIKQFVQKVDIHDGKENEGRDIDGLNHSEEESELEKTFQNIVTAFIIQCLISAVADSHNQKNKRNNCRSNGEDYAVQQNETSRIRIAVAVICRFYKGNVP